MARIPMRDGFSRIPEGEYVFHITDAKYDEDFGKIEVTLKTADGQSKNELYRILNADGELNDKALGAFSVFAKNAINQFDMDDIDIADIVGKYVRADVVHKQQVSTKDASKMVTYVNLENYSPATGFDGQISASTPTGLDLDALLG